ncbi:hypothetical protein [Frigoribacterium sp. CG_9.8]|uniref:hypothetical protein n=1 Tax=Frigoribacterium sp. CG_9.8 TaxID=2787733 RepID=UPI0018CB74DE|nr:hypothetical protein [Frigoribacterium sp. CG_9.8]MBG6106642.1 hypothetical protein [Frigoribacterium sp. CG_9.8]
MSELKSYKHEITGLVGQYSDAVANLFPELRLVTAEPEVTPETESNDGAPVTTKSKREVAS